ncbi:hypothetical protein ASG37_11210 [Sphingomonas sp. Leaf407]|nr:hypothetical protein ASE97_08500 [Sphingomonas sp. Leaf42]KQT27961.1 hypothetical protein ASG37_11210 [Sphingomonas sp. Leaf407]
MAASTTRRSPPPGLSGGVCVAFGGVVAAFGGVFRRTALVGGVVVMRWAGFRVGHAAMLLSWDRR